MPIQLQDKLLLSKKVIELLLLCFSCDLRFFIGTNGIVESLGKDHILFMNYCEQYGFKVIFPLVGDHTILTTKTEAEVKQFLRNQIDEVGNHSALLVRNNL